MLKHRFFSSFAFLNLTQFSTALNDNLYKLLLIFFLISLKGPEQSNTILAIAGAIFVIPFLIFASLAGSLADRFSKRTIIYFTRLFEILTTLLGVVAFVKKSIWGGYAVLFLMATHSAIFSPCKYGIIPEIVPKDRISRSNGIMSSTTYLAIILGTFFASFLTETTQKNFTVAVLFCVLLAILGASFSLGIKKTVPQAKDKKVSIWFVSEIWKSLVRAKKRRYLLTSIIFEAYFLFMGAFTQLNIIPFTLQSLNLTEVHGGYLFLVTAIGIGIGAFLAGRLSGKEIELGFVPIAALGVTFCYVGLYLFDINLYATIVFLGLIGIFGGFYIVPLDSFIQTASPPQNRGQNVATANFLSFIGVIVASFLIAFFGNVLHLFAREGFLIVGTFTLLMALLLFVIYADQVLRLFAASFMKLFWKIKVVGRQKALSHGPVLLVAPRASWIDTLIVMATLPRQIRYIVPLQDKKKKYSTLYQLLWLFPSDMDHFSIGSQITTAINTELREGRSVCLMQPTDFAPDNLAAWEKQLEKLINDIEVPLIPIHISRKTRQENAKSPIKVSYGNFTKHLANSIVHEVLEIEHRDDN